MYIYVYIRLSSLLKHDNYTVVDISKNRITST